MMEKFERFLTLLAMFFCVFGPIWYWGFADKSRHYDYQAAKKVMETKVIYDHRMTIYCNALFDKNKEAVPPDGFDAKSGEILRVNWEHAVPVAELGKNFPEWRNPPPECKRGEKRLSRRACLEQTNDQFRKMTGDMYNLFPALTPMNSARAAKDYADLPNEPRRYGACGAKWARGKFEPPDMAKGQLARATLYMDHFYEEFSLKPKERRLMEEWNEVFPVDKWECQRARRIEKLQGNENVFVKTPCKKAGLW